MQNAKCKMQNYFALIPLNTSKTPNASKTPNTPNAPNAPNTPNAPKKKRPPKFGGRLDIKFRSN